MPKNQRERKKASAKSSRRVAAQHVAAKKLVLPKGRVSRSRLMELTAELDSQMADVRRVNTIKPANAPFPMPAQEEAQTVRDLAEVLRGL